MALELTEAAGSVRALAAPCSEVVAEGVAMLQETLDLEAVEAAEEL